MDVAIVGSPLYARTRSMSRQEWQMGRKEEPDESGHYELKIRKTPSRPRGDTAASVGIARFRLGKLAADGLIHLDLIPRSVGSSEKSVGLVVADDLFGGVVPLQLTTKPSRDSSQVTDVQHLHVGVNIRDRLFPRSRTMQEVGPMSGTFIAFHRQSLVDLADCVFGKRIIGQVFDRLTNQLFPIHKDAAFVAFDQDTVVGVVANDHLGATGIRHVEQEVRRGVVAIILGCISIFEFNRMLRFAADRNWTRSLAIQLECPVTDVDVMRTPVGQFAAGVFIPPSELVVTVGIAATLAIFAAQVSVVDLGVPDRAIDPSSVPAVHRQPEWRDWSGATDGGLNAVDFSESTFGDDRHRFDEQGGTCCVVACRPARCVRFLFGLCESTCLRRWSTSVVFRSRRLCRPASLRSTVWYASDRAWRYESHRCRRDRGFRDSLRTSSALPPLMFWFELSARSPSTSAIATTSTHFLAGSHVAVGHAAGTDHTDRDAIVFALDFVSNRFRLGIEIGDRCGCTYSGGRLEKATAILFRLGHAIPPLWICGLRTESVRRYDPHSVARESLGVIWSPAGGSPETFSPSFSGP